MAQWQQSGKLLSLSYGKMFGVLKRNLIFYLIRHIANIPTSFIQDWQDSFAVLLNQVAYDFVVEVVNLKYNTEKKGVSIKINNRKAALEQFVRMS